MENIYEIMFDNKKELELLLQTLTQPNIIFRAKSDFIPFSSELQTDFTPLQ